MSWDDIDFDLIVPGMITKGPAIVSFSEYLNTFSRALDERLNMLILTPVGSYPELPNITFEVGEIRTQNGVNDSDFWTKLKDMIAEYYLMWSDRLWYTSELMTDPVNHADYLLDDNDLIAIITQETFDILADVQNKIPLEYFTADVINALYEIYKLTLYTRVALREASGDTSGLYFWGSSTLNQTEGLNNMTGQAGSDENFLSFGTANFEARSEYLADRAANVFPFGTRFITDQSTSFQRKEKLVEGEDEDVWSGNYAQAWDLVNIYSRYRDLDDVLLEMEVNASCNVFRNFKGFRTDEFDPTTIYYDPYDSNFPQINPSESSILFNSDDLLGSPSQAANGTKRVWSGNDSQPIPTPVLSSAGPPGEFFTEQQQFIVELSDDIATNINNAALEFFIP